MDPCNDEFCTKRGTAEPCAVCEARAEADRFFRFWFKGGWLIDGVRALKSKGVFAYFSSSFSLPCRSLLILGIVALLFGLIIWIFWVIPTYDLASVKIAAEKSELASKDVYELKNNIRQTCVQALGGAAFLLGLYFTAQTLRTS